MLTVALSIIDGPATCPDLPLGTGTTWVYEAVVSWTDLASQKVRDTTLTWRTEVLSTTDSAAVKIAVVRNWPTALAWWDPSRLPDTSRILCVGNKVYHMDRESTRVPTDDDLLFVFPLTEGKLYGRSERARDDTFYAWFVEEARGDSSFTIAYRSLPDHQIILFSRGLGIREYTYGHHGTVASAHAKLVSFVPGH